MAMATKSRICGFPFESSEILNRHAVILRGDPRNRPYSTGLRILSTRQAMQMMEVCHKRPMVLWL